MQLVDVTRSCDYSPLGAVPEDPSVTVEMHLGAPHAGGEAKEPHRLKTLFYQLSVPELIEQQMCYRFRLAKS